MHGITLDDYRIDWEFKSVCDVFRDRVERLKLPIYLTIRKSLVERQDAADWRLDRFALTANVVDARNHETYDLDKDGLGQYIERLKKPWWKIWQV